MYYVLPAWHGLKTGLTWTVNKQGGIKIENLRNNSDLKVLLSLDYLTFFSITTKTRQNPFGSPPFFAIFQAPPCKVIRIKYAYNHIQVKPA